MLNAAIRDIPLPARLARRPVSERGFPVPWFVSFIRGKWDFVNLDPRKIGEAYRRRLCWLCGEPLGRYFAFAIGPMCSVNRISSEPPAHRECAEYAAKACPFLSRPNARRNEAAQLGSADTTPGVVVEHNPGAVLVWITKSFEPTQVTGGVLFSLGPPVETLWFTEGRRATRPEIDAAMAKGLPVLLAVAKAEGDGAVAELEILYERALKLLPTA